MSKRTPESKERGPQHIHLWDEYDICLQCADKRSWYDDFWIYHPFLFVGSFALVPLVSIAVAVHYLFGR